MAEIAMRCDIFTVGSNNKVRGLDCPLLFAAGDGWCDGDCLLERSMKDMEADLTARQMYVSYDRNYAPTGLYGWTCIVTKDGQEVYRVARDSKREALRVAHDWCTLPFADVV